MLRQLANPVTRLTLLLRPSARLFTEESTSLVRLIEAVRHNNTSDIAVIAKDNPTLIAQQTRNDNTALHEAARNGNVAMISELSKQFGSNFNPNHRCHCNLQRTPIHYAVEGGHFAAVEYLLNHNADPNIKDEKDRTALDYALKRNNSKLAALIVEKGGVAYTMKYQESNYQSQISAHLFARKKMTHISSKKNELFEKFMSKRSSLK